MPILHRCGFPSCRTPTISTYCYHHERFVRYEDEADRVRATARDERITARKVPPLADTGGETFRVTPVDRLAGERD